MANSFWMATAEGSGGRANGSRGRDQPISFHTSEKTDPISTALPKSQFNFHRPWARTRCEYWLWASFMQRGWNATTSPFFFFGVFLSKHTGFSSKRCLLIHMNPHYEEGHCREPWTPAWVRACAQLSRCPSAQTTGCSHLPYGIGQRLHRDQFLPLEEGGTPQCFAGQKQKSWPVAIWAQGVGHKIRGHSKPVVGRGWTLRIPRKYPGFEKQNNKRCVLNSIALRASPNSISSSAESKVRWALTWLRRSLSLRSWAQAVKSREFPSSFVSGVILVTVSSQQLRMHFFCSIDISSVMIHVILLHRLIEIPLLVVHPEGFITLCEYDYKIVLEQD